MKTCACGAGNPDSARFCAECGRSLDPGAPLKCAACGAANAPGARFCTSCGAGLAAGVPRPPAAAVTAFDPKWLVGPIATLKGAQTMAWIGAAGAAALFLHTLIWGAPILQSGLAGQIMLYLLKLVVYGGSAFALYRGWTIGGLASLVLHAFLLLKGLIDYETFLKANPLAVAPALTTGQLLLNILLWVLVPAALVCGIRGAMAWNRFKRGEIAAAVRP